MCTCAFQTFLNGSPVPSQLLQSSLERSADKRMLPIWYPQNGYHNTDIVYKCMNIQAGHMQIMLYTRKMNDYELVNKKISFIELDQLVL